MSRRTTGFTVTELVIALLMASVVMLGAFSVFAAHNSSHLAQRNDVDMEQNLRVAMDVVTDSLRVSGFFGASGYSPPDLTGWLPGFGTSNPAVTRGTTVSSPDTLAIASCFQPAVATLSANAAAGANPISVSSTASLAAGNMIVIGEVEPAKVQALGTNSITIDTDLASVGNQGTRKAYAAGAPICRVDVVTFAVSPAASTLTRSENGGAAETVASGISDMRVDVIAAERQYRVKLTAISARNDPSSGTPRTRSLRSYVTLKNPIGGL